MPHIERMIAAESNTSSSKDELEMLVSARSMRQLGKAIIDLMFNNHNTLSISIINNSPYAGEYNFGVVQRAFAELPVVSATMSIMLPKI